MHLKKILFVVGDLRSFFSHRFHLALDLQKSFKAEIIVIFFDNSDILDSPKKYDNMSFIQISISRGGMNPFMEILGILKITNAIRQIKPDLVHLVTIKPYLYGGIAARIANVPAVVTAVSGLGSLFLATNIVNRLALFLLTPLFYFAFSHKNQRIVFQNKSDYKDFLSRGFVREGSAALIPGMGVDLAEFLPKPEPDGKVVVSFIGRILADKGVREFVKAAEICSMDLPDIEFRLYGSVDDGNPSSICTSELNSWREKKIVTFMGHSANVVECYIASHVICLPSYREGFPKVCMEAAAMGRPVITSDVPGCREAVINSHTGYVVPTRNVTELVEAILMLADSRELRVRMGLNARRHAEKNFDIKLINKLHRRIYKDLAKCC